MSVLMQMSPAQAAAVWSGVLILLLVVLSVRVVLARRSNRVLLGDGGNAQVILAGRVFGNASEYIPVGIAALAVLTLLGLAAYALHMVGALLFAGRLIHALGLSDLTRIVGDGNVDRIHAGRQSHALDGRNLERRLRFGQRLSFNRLRHACRGRGSIHQKGSQMSKAH